MLRTFQLENKRLGRKFFSHIEYGCVLTTLQAASNSLTNFILPSAHLAQSNAFRMLESQCASRAYTLQSSNFFPSLTSHLASYIFILRPKWFGLRLGLTCSLRHVDLKSLSKRSCWSLYQIAKEGHSIFPKDLRNKVDFPTVAFKWGPLKVRGWTWQADPQKGKHTWHAN